MIVLRYQSSIRASRGHTVNNYDLFRKPGIPDTSSYLDDNLSILNNKLQQNLRINADELQKTGKGKERVPVRMVGPLIEIKLMQIYKLFQVREKQSAAGQVLIEVKNFGRVHGEVTKKIHFILTSVARDGRSDFSIISMY